MKFILFISEVYKLNKEKYQCQSFQYVLIITFQFIIKDFELKYYIQIIANNMDYRTPKCNHNQKGMCIHCLVNRGKKQKKQNKIEQQSFQINKKCNHPLNMKCLKCLPSRIKQSACQHPDYEQCKNCQHYIKYETFQQYLQNLANQCKHKKPCNKCVPALSRKTYSIDKSCKNHPPYPQALCDSCMAPTISICKQTYSHVQKVRIMTDSIYKISQIKAVGVLLGIQNNGYIEVYDIYFPQSQDFKSTYLNPQGLGKFNKVLSYFGLKQVGIIYSSSNLSSMSLMVSSIFQQNFSTINGGHQLSKFITMRLEFSDQQTNFQPHFQCFMVSDQFQAFHKNSLIYQKNKADAISFDLITAKHQGKMSQHPTFLRQGVQTDIIYFKEIITWIPTVYEEQKLNSLTDQYAYPYFAIQDQTLDHFKILINIDPRDPIQKYRNIQFLFHLVKLIGIQNVMIFLQNFYIDNADLFLNQKLKLCDKIQKNKDKSNFSSLDSSLYEPNYDDSYR